MAYILGKKEPGCLFCQVAASTPSAASQLLLRWPRSLVMLNRYPYTNGHLMVVPTRHVQKPTDLPAEEFAEAAELLRQSVGVVETLYRPHGMNLGMNVGTAGGAGIESHLHWHLVPRYVGDVNYLTSCADTRLINQSLEATWEGLYPAFSRLLPPEAEQPG
jgi:ATP adenylyltransferase